MINITHKHSTLRKAIAQAVVEVSKEETIAALRERKVPKGDVFEMAKTAGLFAVKRTSDLIPDCHPLPVEFTSVSYRIEGLKVYVEMEVHTIYKTGVEVEAMHGVSVVALTMYDMLKPIDKGITIKDIRLLEKKGGKSNVKAVDVSSVRAAVLVCSDRVSQGLMEDRSGKLLVAGLEEMGIDQVTYACLPDDEAGITSWLKDKVSEQQLILVSGGSGLGPRDRSTEAIRSVLDREIPGIMEHYRNYGQQRIPTAMLSRGVAGMSGQCLIIGLPGSPGAAQDALHALFPAVFHVLEVERGGGH
ncbi:MAG: bifunctional molybdenum cofactor biosynthesis protein MoaC/MoaB [Bacteroidetes bacterium]|nr:MAG: bifunctional molybdenum cofactor biosynthesis protein MoaC/MoaB [Bacteroidota bacterium]